MFCACPVNRHRSATIDKPKYRYSAHFDIGQRPDRLSISLWNNSRIQERDMIAYENVGFCFIMRRLIYFFEENKNQKEPDVCPQHAKTQDHVSPAYPSKESGNDDERKNQKHNAHKGENRINKIDPMQGFQQYPH